MAKPISIAELTLIKEYFDNNYVYSVQLDTFFGPHGSGPQAGPIQSTGPDDRLSSFYSLTSSRVTAWPMSKGSGRANEKKPLRYFKGRVADGAVLVVEFADFSFNHDFIYEGDQYNEVWQVKQMVVRQDPFESYYDSSFFD